MGNSSHAGGIGTIASGSGQTVVGLFNTHNETTSPFIVGGGDSNSVRKDAFKVTQNASIVVPPQNSIPSWTGTEGEMVPVIAGGQYWLFMYIGGQWRSSQFT